MRTPGFFVLHNMARHCIQVDEWQACQVWKKQTICLYNGVTEKPLMYREKPVMYMSGGRVTLAAFVSNIHVAARRQFRNIKHSARLLTFRWSSIQSLKRKAMKHECFNLHLLRSPFQLAVFLRRALPVEVHLL